LVGLDAVKLVLSIREKQVIQMPPRTNKQLFSNTIEKLANGYYNGRSLNSIICDASRFLGERYALYQAIMSANTASSRILSHDGLYALPVFTMRDVDSCDPRFAFYNELFAPFATRIGSDGVAAGCEVGAGSVSPQATPEKKVVRVMPRSREDIEYFLEETLSMGIQASEAKSRYPYDLDMVISYLVRRNLL
jgi:hypothetical protein